MGDFAIETRELTKIFTVHEKYYFKTKKIKALDSINFSVEKGEIFGLLGPNGAGKTTLIRILLGILKPTSGFVRVLGYDPQKDALKIRERVSLLPQEAGVMENLTAKENIFYYGAMHGTIPLEELKRRTEEIIEKVGLKGRENDLTKNFSGGMKRKVLVARSLVIDPEILFLDEPTTGIDILGARIIRNLLKQLSKTKERTIFLTSHDINEIEFLCDRVGIILNGKIIATGSPTELKDLFAEQHLEDVYIGLLTGEGVMQNA